MASPDIHNAPWIDITNLPVPVEEVGILFYLSVASACVVLGSLLLYIWRQPRIQARLKLGRLLITATNTRAQLFQLRRILKEALQTNQLDTLTVDPCLQPEWQVFCQELDSACYQPAIPSTHDTLRLVKQARQWIKRL